MKIPHATRLKNKNSKYMYMVNIITSRLKNYIVLSQNNVIRLVTKYGR